MAPYVSSVRNCALMLAMALGAAARARAQADAGPGPCSGGGLTMIVTSADDTADARPGDGNCADGAGACTLRAAIQESSICLGTDSIFFDIPGPGVHVITLTDSLPDMSDHGGVLVDGTSQPGYAGLPLVEIDATAATLGHAMRCIAGHLTLRGVAVGGAGTHGIILSGSHINYIEACHIGTDASGTVARPNGLYGIFVYGSSLNLLTGNLLSGNGSDGIHFSGNGAFGNVVTGNRVGTDLTGLGLLPNGSRGIVLNDAPRNMVGGSMPGEGNTVAGHLGSGILLQGAGATGNEVLGNRVGTDVGGGAALGNRIGILLDDAPSNVVGSGSAPNVVSGNLERGISISGPLAIDNRIVGNVVGLAADLTTPLGNGREGIAVTGDATGNFVGSDAAGEGNLVAWNGRNGIRIESGVRNRLSANSLRDNGALGIDLGTDLAPTPNDPLDADTGANELQNHPVLASATGTCTSLVVDGTLDGVPSTEYRIEFFRSVSCDPSGHGEAGAYLGAWTGTSDALGTVAISATLPLGVPDGTLITATSTDPAGNTSELSACVVAAVTCGSVCGNTQIEPGEDCDAGGIDTPTCDSDCTRVECGDDHLNLPAGEECDDGNTVPDDGCSAICQIEGCLASDLAPLAPLHGIKAGGGALFSWPADPGAAEYHLNSVSSPSGLDDPRRSPGPATAECSAAPPSVGCLDPDALAVGTTLYYQALSACGPSGSQEGPW